MGIVLAIIIFGIIVIIHELGHMLVAKKNGIVVFEFAIGMGPTLLSKKFGDTIYSLKLLPLGGSCMMGEDDTEEEEELPDNVEESGESQAVEPELKGNFNEKSVWARMAVIFAGPLFNFMLAFVLSVIVVATVGFVSTEIQMTESDVPTPAMEAGLQTGDVITELNGKNVKLWDELTFFMQFNGTEPVDVTYERDGVKNTVQITPVINESTGTYILGVGSVGYQQATPLEMLEYGFFTMKYWIDMVVESLQLLVTGGVSMDEMAGPVGIVTVVGDTYDASSQYGLLSTVISMLNLTILLAANLGVMNLLPIPALDGGRLVFLIIEAIRGKRISPEKEGMAHFVGFALLMVLMVVVLFNDIARLF